MPHAAHHRVPRPVRPRRAARCGGRRGWIWPLLAFALGVPLAAPAQQVDAAPPSVESLKAAFVYKFTLLVTWPDEAFDGPDAPFSLCVLGGDPFAGALEEAVAGRSSQGRALEVRRVETPAPSCHVLYVAADAEPALRGSLSSVRRAPMLTIGETAAFADLGGVIYLLVDDGRMRFEIDRGAARDAGLEISSRLLQVARAVHD